MNEAKIISKITKAIQKQTILFTKKSDAYFDW